MKDKITFRGVEYSIAHLAPMQFNCPCRVLGRDLIIVADFANHRYTRNFDPVLHDHGDIVHYDNPMRPRVFCLDRYALSAHLPGIVTTLPTKKVKQTFEGRNYVFSTTVGIGATIYDIFFMLQRSSVAAGTDLRLTVESAYSPANARRKTAGAIRFVILAHHVYVGKRIKFSPR